MSRLVVAVVLGSVLLVGCSRREGGEPALAPLPTSTTLPSSGDLSAPDLAEDDPTNPEGVSPARIQADLDAAIEAEDTCALLEVLASALPDVEDPAAVIETYQRIAEGVDEASAFVPAELAETWVVVVRATRAGARAAERSGGAIDDPALAAAFSTGEFEAASVRLEGFADANCPAG